MVSCCGRRELVSLEKFMNLPTSNLLGWTVAPLDEHLNPLDLPSP
jgi:hypothetical protein